MALEASDGIPEEVVVELVKVCQVSEVFPRIRDYQRQIEKVVGSVYSFCGSPEFEQAVLQRRDESLDLLIARAVCDYENARLLWERAEDKSHESDQAYAQALKLQLMSGPLAFNLLADNSFSLSDQASIFRQVFGGMDKWNALSEAAFSNPKARHLVEAYAMGKGVFAKQSELFNLCAWAAIAKNPCLNEERDYEDSPDLTAWHIREGVEKLFRDAPVTKHWYYTLDGLVANLNPRLYSFYQFDFNAFIERWTPATSDGEGHHNRDEEINSLYPMLIARLLAKCGGSYEPAKSIKSVSQAVKHQDLYVKAAFLGNGNLKPNEVMRALEEPLVFSSEITFLLENSSIYQYPELFMRVRRYIVDIGDEELVDLLEKNRKLYTSPRFVSPRKREENSVYRESQLEVLQDIKEKVQAMDQARDALERRLIDLENRIRAMFKPVILWAALLAVLVLLK